MSAPLTDQLRDYFRYVEELADDRVATEPIAVLADEPVELLPWPEDPGPVDDRENNMNRNRWGISALAAALVVIVGLVVVAGGGDDPVSTTDLADTPTTEPTRPMSAAEAALATADQWYAAVATGDVESMSALYRESLPGETWNSATRSDDFEMVVWDAAQGSVDTERMCTASETSQVDSVSCTYLNQQRIAELVGAPPVEVTDELRIASDGKITWVISGFRGSYMDVNTPFQKWMELEFPDDAAAVDCCGWESIDDARERGELRLHYAQLWAAYLEENGCTYDAPCP